MIQAITETNLEINIQTEDNRIDTSVASTQIRHLFKFTNDMDKSVYYAYAFIENIKARFTEALFVYNSTTNLYSGRINFLPSGYWKYEVYEVSWLGDVTITETTAPRTETDVLTPPSASKGVVQGLVTKGKMYVSDNAGTEQVQYTQRQEPAASNYIYYGQ